MRQDPDGFGMRASVVLRDLELDPLTFLKDAVAICLYGGKVNEDIVPPIVHRDKSVTLVGAKPLHRSVSHILSAPSPKTPLGPLP